MARKPRSDSVAEALRVAAVAGQKIAPPPNVPLGESDMPFFDAVVEEFARSEWTTHQLQIAAMLARTMADNERDQRVFREEGAVLASDRGTPVINPRKAVIQMNAGIIASYRRSLQLNARATGGETRDVGKRRAAQRAVEADVLGGDDLLARPN